MKNHPARRFGDVMTVTIIVGVLSIVGMLVILESVT